MGHSVRSIPVTWMIQHNQVDITSNHDKNNTYLTFLMKTINTHISLFKIYNNHIR